MNLLPGLNWLTALTARRAAAATDNETPDPGDMGTAFGLDATAPDLPEPPPNAKPASPLADRLVRRPRR
ncbi:hypothetical protein ACVNIS_23330 [Sphaerotilaceae bacterium SBD11-9]